MITTTGGGATAAEVLKGLASAAEVGASIYDRWATLSGIQGGYERRADDWKFQGDTAEKDIQALERQIVGAEIRVAVAEKELSNLRLQIEQSTETESFYRDKYTNVELYGWMVGQLSSLHFQSYQLAFDLAKRAERAWQFELAVTDKNFIQFGYWDSLKKGLLAGERLHHDLKRMDVAYLEANKREYELTRHVSLRDLDPVALLRLRQDGECFVEVPEAWFDLVAPGHYMRRLKTVSLSIPSVTGPYTPVQCTLTLERNHIRASTEVPASGYARLGDDDSRFRYDIVGMQSIVTSQAQDDSGLFETGLRDERYLPFEGAGAISRWKLELPKELRQFDYSSISDVVLHMRYTARDGGRVLKEAATQHVQSFLGQPSGSARLFSARDEFPTEWAKFKSASNAPGQRFEMSFKLRPEHYPLWSQDRNKFVTKVEVFAQSAEANAPDSISIFESIDRNSAANMGTLTKDPSFGNLLRGTLTSGLPATANGELKLFTENNALAALWIAVTWRA